MRVLIVDDHEVVRRGVRSLLCQDKDVEVCGEAVDGSDAVIKAQELKPDVITMDISMPNLNGLDATREIRRLMPDVQILVLSQHDDPGMMKQALNAGANGYVVKSALSTELVAALEKIRLGRLSFDPAVYSSTQTNIDTKEILQRSAAFEKALRRSEDRLRMAQQVARVGTFEWNVEADTNRWTPELEAIYGLPAGSFPGTREAWERLLHPDDRAEVIQALEHAMEDGAFEREWRVIWPDNSQHWILGRAWVFREQSGKAERVIGVNIDITERKQAEERLRERARLLDLSNDAILVRDGSDRITFWNEGATTLYGHTPEEALGQLSHDLFRTEFPEPLDRIKEVLIRTGHWAGELRHTCSDGSKITVSTRWAAERDTRGHIVSILESNRDISEAKRSHEAQNRLAAIVESSDDAIISKDLEGFITSWNKGAERIFGYSAEEAIRRHITLIVPAERLDEESDILARLRRGERIDHFETVRKRKDGTLLDVSVTISPVRGAQGAIVGASKVARDIGERKKMERVLKEAEVAGRLLQLQDDERRRIARELHDGAGQLLAALSMNIAAVSKEADRLSPDVSRSVEESRPTIDQAISEIRTISYLLHPPFIDEVGLKSALRDYVEGFADRSNIKVTLLVPEDLERLPQEVELSLFRVVQECLTNIHRHSGSPIAEVSLSRGPVEIRLEIKDAGCGISRETLEKFQSGRGTGVGLRGMQERMRQIGGTLQIHSNGDGMSVAVAVPLRRERDNERMER